MAKEYTSRVSTTPGVETYEGGETRSYASIANQGV